MLLALTGPGAAAMFLSALITLWTARSTDRLIEPFRRGAFLADWQFPADEWEAFLVRERARLGKGKWALPLVVVGPASIVIGYITYVLTPGMFALVRNLALVGLGSVAAGWALVWLRSFYIRRKIARLRLNPRVLIGPSAVYCGATLAVWNVSMIVLQRVRIMSASPMELEVTTGVGAALQATAALLAVAAPGAAGGAMAGARTVTFVPVPLGKEDEAARVVETLLRSPVPGLAQAPLSSDAPSATSAAAAVPRAVVKPIAARAARKSRRPWLWWASSVALFVLGLIVILAVEPTNDAPAAWSTGNTLFVLAGLSMWVCGFVAAGIGLLASISRFREGRRKRGGQRPG